MMRNSYKGICSNSGDLCKGMSRPLNNMRKEVSEMMRKTMEAWAITTVQELLEILRDIPPDTPIERMSSSNPPIEIQVDYRVGKVYLLKMKKYS